MVKSDEVDKIGSLLMVGVETQWLGSSCVDAKVEENREASVG